jgi:hypothetical protein
MESAMSNRELIYGFETDTLPEAFHHADHVRLAFAYLSEYPVLQALDRFGAALKRYAAARGKSQLYNETITHAYFFLIRERMARTTATEWDEFARGNADLLLWKGGILSRYYQEATLQSDLARSVFLFPDKCG